MAPEDPWDAWRKRGFPFSGPGVPPDLFAQFEKEFARMQGMIGKIMEDAMKHAESPQREQPFVYGFSMRIGKDGMPHLTPFGSAAPGFAGPNAPTIEAGAANDDLVREPLSDVIEGDQEVSVTVELPGVEKKDVSLKVAEETIAVRVDKGQRRYHKVIRLPCKVQPNTAKATFKNSILDVTIQRQNGRTDTGHTVHIE
ncbi:MAG TPA: archaeal heat shock protein Hsp20 [Candidatus Thermoplasmatota archaeon]|nr:archaeal heat shock protein Hsp20 [Candidatus Thermoplasmatota archaeon]